MEEIRKKTIEDLGTLSEDIRQQALKLNDTNNKIQKLQEYLKTVKMDLVIAINKETITDPKTGKETKKYTNEASRTAELERRMKANKDAKDAKLNLDALVRKKAIEEIDYQYERDKFSASKAIARILMEKE